MATPEAGEFAALLKELKDRSGRSYGVLAGRLHVSTSTLHRYCNGEAVPNDYAPVERLARLCGASPEELVELHRRWIVADAARRRPAASEPVAEVTPAPVVAPVAAASAAAETGAASEPAPGPASASDPASASASESVSKSKSKSASESASESASDPLDVTGDAVSEPPRTRFPASRRTRVLLAAAAVVALTVPTSIVVSKLSSGSADELTNAAAVDARDGDEPEETAASVTAPPHRPEKSSSASPSGAAGASSPASGGTPSASAGRGKGNGPAAVGVPPTATISSYNWEEPCGQHYVLDQKPDDVPPPPSPQSTRGWARALGGVDGGSMQLEITVQGRSKQAVVVNGIHVRTLSRKAPLAWSAYSMGEGCGSGVIPQSFDIDLDDDGPVLRPVAGQRGDERLPPKHFPFRVSSTDVEVFDLQAHVEGHDVSWYLELEWSSGGRTGMLRIDDGGKPFRTSSIQARPTYMYRYDTAQWVAKEWD
ncbi:helix-turn-helix domain-containing protein [Streptomyces sp. NPDC058195]|uniref:helix-turn-helix domain-containing protein n=1 Tax=Streptomyces sp. NPDC058195 TaxID=3346375 RepID=UPI0036E818F0